VVVAHVAAATNLGQNSAFRWQKYLELFIMLPQALIWVDQFLKKER